MWRFPIRPLLALVSSSQSLWEIQTISPYIMAHNSQNCPRIIKLILKAVHTCHILYIINFLKVTGMLMVLSWTIDYYIAKDIKYYPFSNHKQFLYWRKYAIIHLYFLKKKSETSNINQILLKFSHISYCVVNNSQ